jgi:pilus assembly protein TadC
MLIPLILFVIVSTAIGLAISAFSVKEYLPLRLDEEGISPASPRKLKGPRGAHADPLKPLRRFLDPLADKLKYLQLLKHNTSMLRITMDTTLFIMLKVFFALSGLAVGLVFLSKEGFVLPLVAFAFGLFIPDIILMRKVRAKKEAIVRYFPETVDLLDMCISAGVDLVAAIKWVIEKSSSNPFIEQLAVVVSEIQVGKPRAQALKDMAGRLKLSDVSSFSRAIVQAERMGTSVEEAFRNLSDDTRLRRFQMGERYAIKASLKILFPLIFCILPAIMIVIAGPIIIKFSQGELIPATF